MVSLAVAFVVSLVITLLVIRLQHLHGQFTADDQLGGVQKFHTKPVPRVGGLGIILGLLAGLIAKSAIQPTAESLFAAVIVACGLPAFIAGLIEDLTKKAGIKLRLASTVFSALLAGCFFGAWIIRLDIPGLDPLLQIPSIRLGENELHVGGVMTIMLTCLCVGGVSNAYNIIDGYNGLAGVVAILVLLGMAYVADQVGDRVVLIGSLAMVGAIAGFLVWNYPNGLIFMGDGGAYLIGFYIAEMSVLLVARQTVVSPWFPLLVNFYPIFETLFSIWRKKVHRGVSPGIPDGAHFHMLVYKRLVRWAVGSRRIEDRTQRNALTSPYLWVLSSFAVIPAVILWNRSFALMLCAIGFAIIYVLLYRMIVKFNSPRWAVLKRRARSD